jgi:predicted component of type VI protein secretion system
VYPAGIDDARDAHDDPFHTIVTPAICVRIPAVMNCPIVHPTAIDCAVEPSNARVMVQVSPATRVHCTTSAVAAVGSRPGPARYRVAVNGVAGSSDPVPVATTRVSPDVAGDGAVATVVTAKFFSASTMRFPFYAWV